MDLNDADLDRVRAAIATAESRTSGELICVVAQRCGDSAWALCFWALCAAIVAPLLWLALGVPGREMLADMVSAGWQSSHVAGATSLWMMAALPALAATATVLLLLYAPLRRALTPRAVRRARVHQMALQQFVAQGVARTHAHTGVLIFLALEERHAEVIADTAIYNKVAPEAWGATIEKLLAGARAGDIAGGFVAAIDEAGALLATHFPAEARNVDELPDHLIILP